METVSLQWIESIVLLYGVLCLEAMRLAFQNMCRLLQSSSDGEVEELQVGLCAMDPATPYGSVSGQLRCQFIFRYYNYINYQACAQNNRS